MASNAIKSDFRSSKMVTGGHFVKKCKQIKVVYWSEMTRNEIKSDFSVIQNGRQRPFCKNNLKKEEVAYWSEMVRITYMQVKKLLEFVQGASWNWWSEVFG